ncbi:MAG TPA: dethiobiotin synthase [Aliidongia sp.]|nr:dethiobiotin synthase [Aliidongia sp.]
MRYFVTATGTDIGKTYVTAALAHLARAGGRSVRVAKPIVSGVADMPGPDSDTALLAAAAGLDLETSLDLISPWRFRAPLSPDMAAAREGRAIDYDALIGFCRTALAGPEQCVLIEGVGGVMVPLDDRHLVRDWIAALKVPTVLVAGSYLGTLSHTLTALETLRQADIEVAWIVISESAGTEVPLDDTVASLRRFARGTPIVTVGRRSGGNSWREATELGFLVEPTG